MIVVIWLLGLMCLRAQVTPPASLSADFDRTALPAQKVGPNDLLAISVYNTPELTRTVRVSPEGNIRLPMLKQPVHVGGLLPEDIETALSGVLSSEGLVNEPFVTVTITQYYSRPISVAGAVRTPVTFQAAGPLRLLEAITRAGGLTSDAGNEILLSRRVDGVGITQRVPVKALLAGADPEYNVALTGGEEIRVPEAGKVFVVGNVKKPGAYAVQEGEITVLKALALAEGLTPYAAKQAYLYRREGSGVKNERSIELKKILNRQSPDEALLADDVLYIPDNSGRRLGIAALERVLLFGSTAGATALIIR